MTGTTRRILIVVTTDVDPEQLDLPAVGAAEVRVIAPLTQLSHTSWLTNDEGAERESAAVRARAVALAIAPGTEGKASLTDNVILAIQAELTSFAADEIVLVVSPAEAESWLETDATWKTIVAFGLPVVRIVAQGSSE